MRDRPRAVYGSPPPPVSHPCALCAESAPRGHRHCIRCTMVADKLPDVGLAIARFVRRAEIEGLRRTVRHWRDVRLSPSTLAQFDSALSRLVEIAMETAR